MRVLITAGPTREPIDEVRYISNRSSGRMGAALIDAALRHGHTVTAILGPIHLPIAQNIARIDIEQAAEMQQAVLDQFPHHDLLIMAAAVADYRPKHFQPGKITSGGLSHLELKPIADIVAQVSGSKSSHQRTIAFSLEAEGGVERAREKMLRKKVDLMVFNPTQTMDSPDVAATLLYPDGHREQLPYGDKASFADILLQRAVGLFPTR